MTLPSFLKIKFFPKISICIIFKRVNMTKILTTNVVFRSLTLEKTSFILSTWPNDWNDLLTHFIILSYEIKLMSNSWGRQQQLFYFHNIGLNVVVELWKLWLLEFLKKSGRLLKLASLWPTPLLINVWLWCLNIKQARILQSLCRDVCFRGQRISKEAPSNFNSTYWNPQFLLPLLVTKNLYGYISETKTAK